MAKTYELIQKSGFLKDAFALEKAVQKKVVHAVESLQRDPFGPKTKRIFHERYKNLYRYRIGDYRVIYAVGTDCISILAVGPRGQIYERFRPSEKDAVLRPGDMASAALQPVPTAPDDPVPDTLPAGSDDEPAPAADEAPAGMDHGALLRGLLHAWGIDPAYHDAVLACRTADALLDLDVPEHVVERILHLHAPPRLDELVSQPSYELRHAQDLADYLDGTLSGFLLRLDPEQAQVASRDAPGPMLVKGGPGTGKSLVALYRIRALMQPEARRQWFGGRRPRVLFLTYTKALTRASEQLLRRLVDASDLDGVELMTLDALASRLVRESAGTSRASHSEQLAALSKARKQVRFGGGVLQQAAAKKALEALENGYLLEEFDWILDGRGIASEDAYVAEPRTGRGTRLDARTRKAVWSLYLVWRELLRRDGTATFTQVQAAALAEARRLGAAEKYDVVVIDEAQDLKPVGIRLAVAMCSSPQGLYLTADENQTIYGRGYRWRDVSDELDFRGRTAVLRRNYRCTHEIQAAAAQICQVAGLEDPESRAEAVCRGPMPLALEHGGVPGDAIAQYFRTWADELRLPVWSSAVLVRSKALGQHIADQLQDAGIAARWVESRDLELDSPFVKVMTMHSAKGLEFPMLCVAGVAARELPSAMRKAQDTDDWNEHVRQEWRLFHVAVTRAMRRLLITFPGADPSPFVGELDTSLWEWQTWQ